MAALTEKKAPQRKRPINGTKPHKTFKKPRKDKTRPPAPSELPSSLLVQDDDPDFPRGGASVLTREEIAEARAEAEEEFERESKKSKDTRKNKGAQKSLAEAVDDFGSLFGDGVTGKLPRFANRITLKNISPRMKLWGVIIEVNTKDLVIGLPGGLRGYVRAEEVSDIIIDDGNKDSESNLLCSIFHVGQLVSCIVVRVDDDKKDGKGNRRIWLSLRLSLLYKGLMLDAVQDGMVLTAQIKSIEDRGYILYFGVSSFTGFLPKSEQDGGVFSSGQHLQCVVKSIDKARAVAIVNSDADLVSKSAMKDLKGLSIDLLVPGMMVNARVHSTLENGIMLSFLTYFTGTVDIFHLQNSFSHATWKDHYNQNKKVNARILFIDPSTRAVGLTLNPYLVQNKAPPSIVRTGEIYDNSRILRVDRGIGLLLEVPSSPIPSPAFVSISDVSDEKVTKLEKKFKEGDYVRVRVLGMRHLDGLAMGTLRASALEGSVFTHSDVKPGMLVKAKVIAAENFGAIVQFSGGVKALCPLQHMSELDILKPPKKFKVGSELRFRVLGCKSKRITVTYKKTLVKSRLPVLASYADATEGLIVHGWITKIEKHGCFVRFYNGVHGFAQRSELGLEPGSEADAAYHVGQAVKCRVISSAPASRRISISFVISPKRSSENDVAKLGSIVSGVVERLTPAAVIIHVNGNAYLKGTLFDEHLADHQGQAVLLKSLLRPGYQFDQLLVLDTEGQNLILSAKYSLINYAKEIPSDLSQIHPLSVVNGYICNIIENGCFVRFLGRLTGFSPKDKVTDQQIDNLLDAFYVGQSVRSHVLTFNGETGRLKLSLKQSLCSSSDVSFIQGYFLLEDKIAALQMSDANNSDSSWTRSFSIGSLVEGEIQEIKEFGVVVSFRDHGDVVGFVTHHQSGGVNVEVGSVVKALVLDIAKSDGLVDLSLKSELVTSACVDGAKKKRCRSTSTDLQLHQTVNGVVEIVKENYLVLSIPEYNYAIGYASITDYNMQKLPRKHFLNGQSVLVTVGVLPSSCSSGRLLLLLKSAGDVSETSRSKRARKMSSYTVGSLVVGEIIDIKPLELILKFGTGFRGRIHITEVFDNNHAPENPFSKFKIGQLLDARIVAKLEQSGKSGKGYQWELSVRPSLLTGESMKIPTAEEFNFSVGSIVRGYVVKVDGEWVWLTVSRSVMSHIFVLDSSCEPGELQEFQQRYSVGQAVKGKIISINKEKKLLRLASCPSSSVSGSSVDHEIVKVDIQENKVSNVDCAEHIIRGDIVGGKVKRILPGVSGLLVQIGPHLFGKAHYTELIDTWVPQPLCGYHEGQFVKCKILEITRSLEGTLHVDLSLRSSLQDIQSVDSTVLDNNLNTHIQRFEKIEDLHPNMDVQGYVKNVTSKGCFIMLSRMIDARILLSNLSDGYIENPEKEFPAGKLVHGRVLSVDPASKRVEVTLKTEMKTEVAKSDASVFCNLHVGDVISGQIRRIEPYGLFIAIDNTNVVGLCHKSELSDEPIDNIETRYKAGDRVVAKVLKVDEERHRISLGMKKSYIGNASDAPIISRHGTADGSFDGISTVDDTLLALQQNDDLPHAERMFGCDNEACAVLEPAETRASVLPLQVVLDDSDGSDLDNVTVSQEIVNLTDMAAKKSDRRTKKKAKEERELEISASEERNLQKDIPKTADEFEKLVRSSPNSSFVWIKYMAFMLSLADVEKARSIAERALRTINIREEGEKLNIWVACFNLENEYGSPPEEAVKKTFQRALQYCDPKKLYLALLGMYERTEQHKLADELLERMTKKFKNSCKVWLHCVQSFLKQDKDGIQSLVNRALLSLSRNKHIKFISQTAILEFKFGVPDRGRSMFEGILREYPKRTDLWSIYLDQEIRLGDVEVIRALFERATFLSLPPKKMKFLFKKYLEYEKAHGDEDRIEHVKKRALEYVESSLA
ncbi:rRNA biogenesis protein RRP5 isoform X2 [Elaeis guineensis]|uniref:rRNA biogenesis protein RRP5 n=1 Tax=Elaeis guineensis var. tenera TaxID=51953 RepID=A0A6I9RZ30_ELAGV|nr:rRNA biogenesis protein RRP5 isoform X2 [Elaeis guineensis]